MVALGIGAFFGLSILAVICISAVGGPAGAQAGHGHGHGHDHGHGGHGHH
ncbi:MAG TPA: hypothetical protein VEB20_16435 [Azospirillaceae bacterium]|nr:hypothetical protein [Azospirillaceae bacterium]